MPDPFVDSPLALKKRGGSTASATGDPSSYPTTPPASTYTHFKPIPKIGGSEGGFIGLVVALSVIFVGSCVGVFFLLRYRHHGGRTTRTKSGEIGVEPPDAAGFPRRRGTLFGFRSQNPKSAGWVRAPGEDEDEWDSDVHDLHDMQSTQERGYGSGGHGFGGDNETKERPYSNVDGISSVSTVRLSAPHDDEGARSFTDPFDAPMRSTSPTHDPNARHPEDAFSPTRLQDRHMSVDSAKTLTSLPGGTKFKEDI